MSKAANAKNMKAEPTEQSAAVQNDDVKPVIQNAVWLLKEGNAAKLGKQTQGGSVGYQVLSDVDRLGVFIRLTVNVGGTGYFSRELVSYTKVQDCLRHLKPGEPFASKAFRQGLFTGRSSNDASFFAAVLHSLGLLKRAPETESQHVIAGAWDEWQKTMLSEAGQLIQITLPVPGTKPVQDDAGGESQEPSETPKAAGKKRLKLLVPENASTVDDAEPGHAHLE